LGKRLQVGLILPKKEPDRENYVLFLVLENQLCACISTHKELTRSIFYAQISSKKDVTASQSLNEMFEETFGETEDDFLRKILRIFTKIDLFFIFSPP